MRGVEAATKRAGGWDRCGGEGEGEGDYDRMMMDASPLVGARRRRLRDRVM